MRTQRPGSEFPLFKRAVICILALWFAGLPAASASAADFEFEGEIEARDSVSHLLAHYVGEFTPEEFFLAVDGQPDASGRIRELYMDLTGVPVGGVRLDKLVFRMSGAQFNPPSEWPSGEIECKDALQIYAYALLKEDDVNRHLTGETFGDGDHWSNISMKISPSGLYARGNYSARMLFIPLNILIEVDSGLKIVDNRSLWLDNYKLRVNRLDVPGYITRKAVEQIQPLLDLNNFPLPLRLHKVELEDGQAALSTRILPTLLEGGITYHYRAATEAEAE